MRNDKLVKLSGLAAVALLTVGAGCDSKSDDDSKVSANATQPVADNAAVPVAAVDAKKTYKDGDYAVVTTFKTPGGDAQLDVKLTVKDGVITAATAKEITNHPISQKMGEAFDGSFKPVVIGKPINGLNLDVVAGASLTTGAFNDALNQIRTKAS